MSRDLERRHSLRKSQLIDFPNAAAGHDGVKSNRSGDLIVKPCKNAEVDFYQQNWKAEPGPDEFAYYMPKFFGTLNLQDNPPVGHARTASHTIISHLPVNESLAPTEPPKSWKPRSGHMIDADNGVVLENIASGFTKPNILDIKLGARLWADDAPIEKRERMDSIAANTTSGSVGFRVAGMKLWAGHGAYYMANREAMDRANLSMAAPFGGDAIVHTPARDNTDLPKPSIRDDDYASYDKEYGRALTKDNVRKGLEEYFYRPQTTGIRRDQAQEVITRFIQDLKGLEAVLERQETRMYSASLLFVYEGSGLVLRESFRKENRMIREARLAKERLEAGDEDDARQDTILASHVPVPRQHMGHFTNSAALVAQATTTTTRPHVGAPQLQQIDIGSSLEMPAQLTMANAQMIEAVEADNDHESASDDEDDEDREDMLPKIQAVKMIDFAHATSTPGQGPDLNVLRGLRNVIATLEDLLRDGEHD